MFKRWRTKRALRRAYKLIELPEHWCKFHYAINKWGQPVAEKSPNACSWCAVGAWKKVTNMPVKILDKTAIEVYGTYMYRVNDELGHEAVLKVYREAIKSV